MSKTRKVAILGAGAWGTALALVAARAGQTTKLWGRDPSLIDRINSTGRNGHYLPGIELQPPVSATTDLETALSGASILMLAVPAQAVASTLDGIRAGLPRTVTLVCCAKGIDRISGRLPAQTVASILPENPVAALSGPSFAVDVARGLPTAVTIASEDASLAESLGATLSTPKFRCYASDDLTGVELGGALKNIIALAVGAARGMGLGASAEAALVARGFAELCRLAKAMGARESTLAGLSGLGDLVLTCSSEQSRNFSYGMALGRGDSLLGLPLAEGAFSAEIAAKIAIERGIETPVIQAVSDVLSGTITPAEAVERLLDRPLRRERE